MSAVPTVTIGSLFSGIGGFDLGFEQAGLGPVLWQAEIDPVCRRVLKKHFPGCSIFEDIRECGAHNLAQVDIICGGFPCQDVSVAGKRAGIGGEQSGLFHEMVRIIDELKPAFAVWENVPGLGTSFSPVEPPPEPVEGEKWDVEEDNDFETVLRAFRDIGYFGSGRVLDAEYFGLAQRRERWFGVFARGDIGAGRCAEILSLAEGLSWHPAPRRKAGQGIAASVAPSLANSGNGVERAGDSRGQDPVIAVTGTMSSKWAKGTGGPSGDEAQNLVAVAELSPPITGNQYGDHESREGLLIAHTLRAEGFDASEDGTGRGTPLVTCYENHGQDSRVKDCGDLSPTIHAKAGTGGNNLPLVAFQPRIARNGRGNMGDTVNALQAQSRQTGKGDAAPCVAYRTAGNCGPFETGDRTACMNTATDPNQTIIKTRMAMRRLTPRECTRLQGFPDTWLEDTNYADAEEAGAGEVLRSLWRTAGEKEREGWRSGIATALFAPEVLLAGVYGGWISWEMATQCAESRGEVSGENAWPKGFVRTVRETARSRPSPYRRESFKQLARELGRPLSELPLEEAQAAQYLLGCGLREAITEIPSLRQAFTTGKAGCALHLSDSARYRMLGNAVAVPVARWIGKRMKRIHGTHTTEDT